MHGVPAADAGRSLGLTEVEVERVYRDIEAKRRVANQLDGSAILVDPAASRKGRS